jgi:hypothetical protein
MTCLSSPYLTSAGISDSLRDLLFIEYHYIKMYINSLAIQAIVERAVSQSPSSSTNPNNPTKVPLPTNLPLHDEILISISPHDYQLTATVVNASTLILRKTTDCAQNMTLRYAPVRIYLRIVSASIFLLKAISIGARSPHLNAALAVLDECIAALQASVTDEMHLGSRYGTLIARHVSRFRRNFRTGPGGDGGIRVGGTLPLASRGTYEGQGFDAVVEYEPVAGDDPLIISGDEGFAGEGGIDDWLSQPFDPSVAPFGVGSMQFMGGLELGSLDFLWNLPA